jgi:NTE family protein
VTETPRARRPPVEPRTPDYGDLALVMSGGGARGAYQVGLLRFLARRFPDLTIPILTGVSAGAVNIGHLAQHHGTFAQAVDELTALWLELLPERVFRVDAGSLAGNVARSGLQLVSGGLIPAPGIRGMVDTSPLRSFLEESLSPVDGELTGIDYNLHRGTLKGAAITTTSYTTGQTIIWVQGRQIRRWERSMRRSVPTRLRVDHIMASTALPLFFPAVRIGNAWYGDGGVRLTAPLSPALHMGASKILTISTHYNRTPREADRRDVEGYPPPAQVLGVLYNAVFLDLIDQDAVRMERFNSTLRRVPTEARDGMRLVDLLVLRPSQDLGLLAANFEPRLPRAFRFLSRGLGTRETRNSDLLSMVMFQPDYLRHLIELGEADAEARGAEIMDFISE